MHEIVLFGCGNNGRKLAQQISGESKFIAYRLKCFVDSNPMMWGENVEGIEVCSFYSLQGYVNDYIWIITACGRNGIEISNFLEENGIESYLYYDELSLDNKGLELSVSNEELRMRHMQRKCMYYQEECKRLEAQNTYLLSHVSPATMDKAEGYLRKKQKRNIAFADSFFRQNASLNVNPILCGGNLLGYLRHDGYIPWDDDLDFLLFRDQYDRVVNHFREKGLLFQYFGEMYSDEGELVYLDYVYEVISKNRKQPLMIMYSDHSMIIDPANGFLERAVFDLLPWDLYDKKYSYTIHKDRLLQLRDALSATRTCAEKYTIIECFKNDDASHYGGCDGNAFPGPDDVFSYTFYIKNNDFLPANKIFPVREAWFEGYKVYVPFDVEAFVKFVYGEKWNHLPCDTGLNPHDYVSVFASNRFEIIDIMVFSCDDVDRFEELFWNLRRSDKYVKYVLLPWTKDHDKIEFRMRERMVDYTFTSRTANCVICCSEKLSLAQKIYGISCEYICEESESFSESEVSAN